MQDDNQRLLCMQGKPPSQGSSSTSSQPTLANPDRRLTFLLCELVQDAGLPDAHVADDDVLEDVRVVVRGGGHGGGGWVGHGHCTGGAGGFTGLVSCSGLWLWLCYNASFLPPSFPLLS